MYLSTRFFARGHLSLNTLLTLSPCLPQPLSPQVKTDFAEYRGRLIRNYFPQSRRRSRIMNNFIPFFMHYNIIVPFDTKAKQWYNNNENVIS